MQAGDTLSFRTDPATGKIHVTRFPGAPAGGEQVRAREPACERRRSYCHHACSKGVHALCLPSSWWPGSAWARAGPRLYQLRLAMLFRLPAGRLGALPAHGDHLCAHPAGGGELSSLHRLLLFGRANLWAMTLPYPFGMQPAGRMLSGGAPSAPLSSFCRAHAPPAPPAGPVNARREPAGLAPQPLDGADRRLVHQDGLQVHHRAPAVPRGGWVMSQPCCWLPSAFGSPKLVACPDCKLEAASNPCPACSPPLGCGALHPLSVLHPALLLLQAGCSRSSTAGCPPRTTARCVQLPPLCVAAV